MTTGETGFSHVSFDLISLQYHALKAGHDYGRYVRDAQSAGLNEIATFFEQVMAEDSRRAHRCHEFLTELMSKGGTEGGQPTAVREVVSNPRITEHGVNGRSTGQVDEYAWGEGDVLPASPT